MFWPLMVYSESANGDFHKSLVVNFLNFFCKERFVRGARAAILCYAVTDPESWERLQFWVRFYQL